MWMNESAAAAVAASVAAATGGAAAVPVASAGVDGGLEFEAPPMYNFSEIPADLLEDLDLGDFKNKTHILR